MKRPLQIILAGLVLIVGLLTFWNRMRARAEADLWACLLYTSDAADDLLCVDLGGRRIIKKK